MLFTLISGFYAGIMIGLGATAKLLCENPYVGSALFCLGLCTVIAFQMDLFTGKVGNVLYARSGSRKSFAEKLPAMLFGNLLGAILCALFISIARPDLPGKAFLLMQDSLEKSLLQTFSLACLCGVCMYIAVTLNEISDKMPKCIGVFLAIPTFILCGYKHSIAETFYYVLARCSENSISLQSAKDFFYLIFCILGNAAGSIFTSLYLVYLVKTSENGK